MQDIRKWRLALMLVFALVIVLAAGSGCTKAGTSGLTFYEFFDPT